MDQRDESEFEISNMRPDAANGDRPARWQRLVAWAMRTRRIIGGLGAVVGILAVLAVILAGPANRLSLLRALHLAPSPTPDPAATGSDELYLEHGLPWGVLKLDGKPVSLVDVYRPYTGLEGDYTLLRLATGTHRIEYSAAPFPTLTCRLSVPAASADTCPLIHPGPQDVHPVLSGERLLDLGGEPDRLAPEQQSALLAAVTRALAVYPLTAPVAQGEPILTTDNAVIPAPTPLTATLLYTPNDEGLPSGAVSPTLRACPSLCSEDVAAHLNQPTATWGVGVRTRVSWLYTDAAGRYFGQSATALTGNGATQGIVTVAVRWDGAWQVNLDFGVGDIVCAAVLSQLTARLPQTSETEGLQAAIAENKAQGCLITARELASSASPVLYFVYRFGIVLAANSFAHAAMPQLPMAGAPALALARQLGAHV